MPFHEDGRDLRVGSQSWRHKGAQKQAVWILKYVGNAALLSLQMLAQVKFVF